MTINSKYSDKESIGYSFPFLFLGLFLFIMFQGCFIFILPKLLDGNLQAPVILAGIHLFILGFATTIAMGAIIQLVPVALQVKLISRKLIPYHFLFYLIGIGGLIWSFYELKLVPLILFGCTTLIGILLFEINILPAVLRAKSSPIKWGIFSAIIYLFLTVSLGITMVIDFQHPFLGNFHDRLFAIHVIVGFIGWFTLLIISFSYKLVPMFSLSHNYESRWARTSILLINIGIICLTIGFLFMNSFIKGFGGLFIIIGLFSYGKQISLIFKNRLRKELDVGIKSSLYAGPFTLFCFAIGYGVTLILHKPLPVGAFMYAAIMGWVGLVIVGYLHKIIPFLWWTFKYSSQIGQRYVPSLKELVNEKLGVIWITGLYLFTFFNVLFLSIGFKMGLTLSQGLLFLVALFYVINLIKIVVYHPKEKQFYKKGESV